MRIEDFKDKIGGGARPALFRVGGRIGASGTDDRTRFLVTAANLPQAQSVKQHQRLEEEQSNFLCQEPLKIGQSLFFRTRIWI